MSFNNIPQKQLSLIRNVMLFTGVTFIGLSTLILAKPDMMADFLNLDAETTQILSYAFLFIGTADIIISLFIFRRKNRT